VKQRAGADHGPSIAGGADRLDVPHEAGPSDALSRERASATPSKNVARPLLARDGAGRSRETRHVGGSAIDVPLRVLQHWFAAAVMFPGGVAAAIEESGDAQTGAAPSVAGGALYVPMGELERVLLPSKRLAGIERLAIYGDAYRARLVECLADDYPALQHALGQDVFEALCLRYIERHPSTSPNLNSFGRHMAKFCRDAERSSLEFGADMAALEWAMVEVLHAPSAEKLDLATLATVPAERWATARFAPSQTVRVLAFAYPVNAYFQAFRTDQSPKVPAPGWSATAVFRDGATIWRMDLGRAKHDLLMMLFDGTPLGPALDTLAAGGHVSEGEGAKVMVWFRDWVKYGFFARIEPG
jgi:hypothetical protein